MANLRMTRDNLTTASELPIVEQMEVQFSSDLQDQLISLARQEGRNAEDLVCEAVRRLVDYDTWFVSSVEKGVADADRGDLIEHADVRGMIDVRYPERE